tara:strand:- start:29 stop:343 length:315 start_codon:yes stop_codon:yes gene_type:complete
VKIDFITHAKNTLNIIFEKINNLEGDIEVDLVENNLNIELGDQRIFIVSIHEPTKQIWLSSPISGAHHFNSIDDDNIIWESTRNSGIYLLDIIFKELRECTDEN